MGLALQVKTSTFLPFHPASLHPILQIQFSVLASRLISQPRFWYLFGCLDHEKMGFGDLLSAIVSEKSYAKRQGDRWHF